MLIVRNLFIYQSLYKYLTAYANSNSPYILVADRPWWLCMTGDESGRPRPAIRAGRNTMDRTNRPTSLQNMGPIEYLNTIPHPPKEPCPRG